MQAFIPENLKEEDARLSEIWINSEDLSVDEVIDRFASVVYKNFYRKEEKRRNDLLAQGIIVN